MGRLRLALELPAGDVIAQVEYTITSGNLTPTVTVTGSVDTSDPNVAASVLLDFPPSTGDSVSLSATSGSGQSCTGLATGLDLTPGQVTMVGILLVCGG
jgi:hypothetical protein